MPWLKIPVSGRSKTAWDVLSWPNLPLTRSCSCWNVMVSGLKYPARFILTNVETQSRAAVVASPSSEVINVNVNTTTRRKCQRGTYQRRAETLTATIPLLQHYCEGFFFSDLKRLSHLLGCLRICFCGGFIFRTMGCEMHFILNVTKNCLLSTACAPSVRRFSLSLSHCSIKNDMIYEICHQWWHRGTEEQSASTRTERLRFITWWPGCCGVGPWKEHCLSLVPIHFELCRLIVSRTVWLTRASVTWLSARPVRAPRHQQAVCVRRTQQNEVKFSFNMTLTIRGELFASPGDDMLTIWRGLSAECLSASPRVIFPTHLSVRGEEQP